MLKGPIFYLVLLLFLEGELCKETLHLVRPLNYFILQFSFHAHGFAVVFFVEVDATSSSPLSLSSLLEGSLSLSWQAGGTV